MKTGGQERKSRDRLVGGTVFRLLQEKVTYILTPEGVVDARRVDG